jgi:hypothetical protein
MSKGPILLLGAAAVAGIAIAVHSQSATQTSSAAPATAPKGTSAKDLTTAQKKKLETWAKSKGVPVDKAYELAQSLYGMKF